jgi:hypothetical protein
LLLVVGCCAVLAHLAAKLTRYLPEDVLSFVVEALAGQDAAAASAVARAWKRVAHRGVRELKGVRPTSIPAALRAFRNATDLEIQGPAPVAGEQPAAAAGAAGGQGRSLLLLAQFLAAPAEARRVRRLSIVEVDALEALGEAAAIADAVRAAGGSGSGDWLLSVRRLELCRAPVTPRGLQRLCEGLPALEELTVYQTHWLPVCRAPMAAHTLPALRRLELRGGGGAMVGRWQHLPLLSFAPNVQHLVLAGIEASESVDLAGLTRLKVQRH